MDGKVIIGTEIDTTSFDAQIEDIKRQLEEIDTILSNSEGMDADEIIKYNAEAEKLNNRLTQLVKKKNELNQTPSEIGNFFGNLKNNIEGSIKKVKTLIFGIFGIRGAYMAVRNAVSVISSDDAQMKADIDYIKNVLAYALEPIVRTIVGWVKILVSFLGYLAKSWFNYDIFAKATAKSLKNSVGSAKELHKQLAGFDEMTVLQDTNSGGGGAGGGALPDFSAEQNAVEEFINDWFKKGEEVRQMLFEMPFEIWTEAFGNWDLAVYGVVQTFYGLWEMITGLFEFIKGVLEIIVGIFTGDTDLIWKGVQDLIDGIWQSIQGMYNFIHGIMNALGGLVLGILRTIKDWIIEGVKWIYDYAIKPIGDFFVGLWNGMAQGFKDAWINVKQWFSDGVEFIKNLLGNIWNRMIEFGSNIGSAIAGAFKGVVNAILSSVEWILNTPIRAINKLIDTINILPNVNLGKLGTFSLPRLARGGIVNNPGPGVMMGSYIAGEKGPEAVIPLNDETLDKLGEAFARHTIINANIINSMNGKVISRELQRIQNENDFAYNR